MVSEREGSERMDGKDRRRKRIERRRLEEKKKKKQLVEWWLSDWIGWDETLVRGLLCASK